MTLPQVLLVLAVVALIAILAYRRVVASRMAASVANRRHLVPGVDAGGQILPTDIVSLKAAGYRTLINMRPDDEAADQPPSDAIASAAREFGLAYAYVPTPAANIADDVIDDLSQTLATAERPVLVYCRSGTRVARAWALAEASRPGGLDRDGIIDAVGKAGFNVDDLLPRIDARLSARQSVPTS